MRRARRDAETRDTLNQSANQPLPANQPLSASLSQSVSVAPVIAVHGGAWNISDEEYPIVLEGCREAAEVGYRVLTAGGSALDAVEEAVVILENNPAYDAGYGSVLSSEGRVQLDAAMMHGPDLGFAALASLERVKNPVRAARKLLAHGKHVLLVGEAADRWAGTHGVPLIENAELVHPRERALWEKYRAQSLDYIEQYFAGAAQSKDGPPVAGDTVGAVARDVSGRLAAANSTGGTPFKHPGRVGDTPLPGCGILADNEAGAVCCTGWGELIARTTLASRIVRNIEAGAKPDEAIQSAFEYMLARVGGRGGAICVTPDGRVGAAHTTARMAWAAFDARGRALGPVPPRRHTVP